MLACNACVFLPLHIYRKKMEVQMCKTGRKEKKIYLYRLSSSKSIALLDKRPDSVIFPVKIFLGTFLIISYTFVPLRILFQHVLVVTYQWPWD